MQPLAHFQGSHEVSGVQQRCVGAGIKPGVAAPHAFDLQLVFFQVHFQQCRYFDFTTGGRLNLACAFGCITIEEVEASDGKVGGRHLGFFNNRLCRAVFVKGNHAVSFRIGDMVPKYCSTFAVSIGFHQQLGKRMPEEQVVPQNQGRWCPVEKILGQDVGLRQPVRAGLHNICQRYAPL